MINLNRLENEKITINEIGFLKAISIMFSIVILESLGYFPKRILSLYSKEIGTHILYIHLIIDAIIKYYIIVLLLKVISTDSDEEPNKKILNKKNFIYVTLMIIGSRMFFNNSLYYWVENTPIPKGIEEEFTKLAKEPLVFIISSTIIAPIYEELIFRGIVLKGMLKKYTPTIALILSSLLFAIIHMNIPQGINAFFLGLIIGFIYLNTGSIYLSILAHCVNNIIACLPLDSFKLHHTIAVSGMCFVLGLILIMISYKWHKKNSVQAVLSANNKTAC